MQKPPLFPSRLGAFLASSPGRRFASVCAISSLVCLTISVLLDDCTRLAWPFVVASIVLVVFGAASPSRLRLAQMVMALWVIQANIVLTNAINQFDLGDKPAILYQQTLKLEEQANHMWPQLMNLYIQEDVLQQELKDNPSPARADIIQADLRHVQAETDAFHALDTYGNLADTINYNEYLLQDNTRNFPTDAILHYMQSQIGSNATLIKQNQQTLQEMDSLVNETNALLPGPVDYRASVPSTGMSCTMFPCLESYTWEQAFITGWQNIASQPLSVTWPFWLGLSLSLLLWCSLLPRWQGPQWVLAYRRRYVGPLLGLRDKALPAELQQAYSPETTVIKIEVSSRKLFLKQGEKPDEPRELLRLFLGTDMSIQRLFLGSTPADSQAEVELDRNTGEVVLKMQPLQPLAKFPKGTTYKERRAIARAMRRFPVQVYAIVDTFAGTITATTPVTEIERLEERRGPAWLYTLGVYCHQFAWWALAIGLWMVLMICSHLFFRGLNTFPQTQSLYIVGLGLFGAFLLFLILDLVIARTTTRRQTLQPTLAL